MTAILLSEKMLKGPHFHMLYVPCVVIEASDLFFWKGVSWFENGFSPVWEFLLWHQGWAWQDQLRGWKAKTPGFGILSNPWTTSCRMCSRPLSPTSFLLSPTSLEILNAWGNPPLLNFWTFCPSIGSLEHAHAVLRGSSDFWSSDLLEQKVLYRKWDTGWHRVGYRVTTRWHPVYLIWKWGLTCRRCPAYCFVFLSVFLTGFSLVVVVVDHWCSLVEKTFWEPAFVLANVISSNLVFSFLPRFSSTVSVELTTIFSVKVCSRRTSTTIRHQLKVWKGYLMFFLSPRWSS